MATYAIGDIQGCYTHFKSLLKKIDFNINRDRLWFVGDLVNRGPDSLATLQAIYDLSEVSEVVLGNHDFHLIACAYGARSPSRKDTIQPILEHSDCPHLIEWLLQRPLLVDDANLGFCMTHAGIPPIWTLDEAQLLARETMAFINQDIQKTIGALFSNSPNSWSNELTGLERAIAVVNYLTRMRYLSNKASLDFNQKNAPNTELSSAPRKKLEPWFNFASQVTEKRRILFGHWAALEGVSGRDDILALDTGCVWGGPLTALRLEDLQQFQVF